MSKLDLGRTVNEGAPQVVTNRSKSQHSRSKSIHTDHNEATPRIQEGPIDANLNSPSQVYEAKGGSSRRLNKQRQGNDSMS